ncbi:hypothetical protein OOT46_21960 [Aquabacterium sp. A7-Y]|nr:hypothetical protein [Aquabacterium sp. A7-Y]MCW7540493.1 hypothetical protein [Aquabacterium sp. A7-Y]
MSRRPAWRASPAGDGRCPLKALCSVAALKKAVIEQALDRVQRP